jgi:hypothetical protein
MIVKARRSAQSETLRGEVGSVTTRLLYHGERSRLHLGIQFAFPAPQSGGVCGFIFGVSGRRLALPAPSYFSRASARPCRRHFNGQRHHLGRGPARSVAGLVAAQRASILRFRATGRDSSMTRSSIKAGLARANAGGKKLGGHRAGQFTDEARAAGRRANKARADARAAAVAPIVAGLQAGGAWSLRTLAAALNNCRIPTPRGCKWQPGNVARLLARLQVATRQRGAVAGAAAHYPLARYGARYIL